MQSFTISLTSSDWDADRAAWRCSAVQIPGAKVEALYAGAKVDDAWYKVEVIEGFIRWSHGDPPDRASATILLTKELSTKESTGFWKNVSIVVPIITAAISGFAGWKSAPKENCPPVTPCPTASLYETWRVMGRVALELDGESMFDFHVATIVRPPRITLERDGSFDVQMPVENDPTQGRLYPSMTFDPHNGDFDQPVVHLGDKDSYDQVISTASHTINISKQIEFTKLKPYSQKAAAKQQEVAAKNAAAGN